MGKFSYIPTLGKRFMPSGSGHRNWGEVVLPADLPAGQAGDAAVMETTPNKSVLWFMAGLVVVAAIVLGLRLVHLQILQGSRNFGLAEGNRIRQKLTRAPRGVIYDRNGKVLVRNIANFDLTVVPSQLPRKLGDRQEVFNRLGQMLEISPAEIATKAEANGLRYPLSLPVAANLDRQKALLMDQSTSKFPGFSLDVNPVREYLDNGLLSHIFGYTGRASSQDLAADPSYSLTDYIGKLGLERQYESLLKGQNGSQQTEVDASGNPIRVLASKPSKSGSDLILSLDFELQVKLVESLKKHMDLAGAKKASAVALDPKTGEVLASVSLPTYDNNLFSRGISQTDYDRLLNDPGQPLFNKVVSGVYKTGSIIKPLVASAALEEKVVSPNTVIMDEGKLEVVNKYDPGVVYTFRGWEQSGLGAMTVRRAIAMSSNIYFYTVGGGFGNIGGLGIDKLASYYHKFGLGAKTGIDLPNEASGRVPTPDWKLKTTKEAWFTGDTYNLSVGQGDIAVSPLQIVNATASIANGGNLLKPRLVQAIRDETGQARSTQVSVIRKLPISAYNLTVTREGMRQAVESGTACCIMDKQVPVKVAGKTGTAETNPGKEDPHAWFTAFAPYEDPQIVMAVLVEHAPGEGAEYAAPVARETLAWYFSRPR